MTARIKDPCANCGSRNVRPHCGSQRDPHPTCTWRRCDDCRHISDRKGRSMPDRWGIR